MDDQPLPRLPEGTPPCPPRLNPVVLEGRFVRLEPLDDVHLPDLTDAALRDPRTWDYMAQPVRTPEDVRAWIEARQSQAASGLALAFAVVERSTGRGVGSSGFLDYRPADRSVEIGHTWYAPSARGSAVNPEAKLLLLRHAFEGLRVMRVQLKTDARNLRSRRAILKLGATEEGVLRKHMLRHGTVIRDSALYSILDDEWPAVEAGLQSRLHALGA